MNMQTCPTCGTPIDEVARAAGVCQQCATPLSVAGASMASPAYDQIAPPSPHVGASNRGMSPAAPMPAPHDVPTVPIAPATPTPPPRSGLTTPVGARTVPMRPQLPPSPPVPSAFPTEDLEDRWGPKVPLEDRLLSVDPLTLASARPVTRQLDRLATTRTSPNQSTIIIIGVGVGAMLLLVMACTLTFASAAISSTSVQAKQSTAHPTVTIAVTATDAGLGFATQVPNPTALPYTQATPTLEPTETPYGGIPTPTLVPPTATPTATQPLALAITNLKCNPEGSAATMNLVTNATTPQPWTATISPGIVSPAAGVVSAEQVAALTVANINHNAVLTVTSGTTSQAFPVTCP